MHATDSSASTRFKVGIFTVIGLALIGALTVYVNDKPYWWRPCQLVHISVEDATGLKSKSPVRSLGLEIGYIKTVDLAETHVDLGICITAAVQVLPSTRAYIRSEGFLGDKFVELKPVKYSGARDRAQPPEGGAPGEDSGQGAGGTSRLEPKVPTNGGRAVQEALRWLDRLVENQAFAEDAVAAPAPTRRAGGAGNREIPVGESTQDVNHLVNRVDQLVNEMTNLTNNLKQAINPEELRTTMRQLNQTLANASKTLSPEGGLNQTAQRTLAKLEDAIEQLRDMLTRMNKGEGSVGMLINDPSYAEEIHEAIRNVNKLLSKVGGVRFVVDIGGEEINAYNGGRGYFRLAIWPQADRYYLIGISLDPRGRLTDLTTTTTAGSGASQVTTITTTHQVEQTGLLLTGMLGKVFYRRFEFALGALNGDGAVTFNFRMGPRDHEEMLQFRNDVYSRGSGFGIDDRATGILFPFGAGSSPLKTIYFKAGIESFKAPTTNAAAFLFGAGLSFDDDDIKLLFALR